jgi:hypothetical protein
MPPMLMAPDLLSALSTELSSHFTMPSVEGVTGT